MEKKLTREEALNLTDQLIQKEMVRSNRSYKEVSQEFRRKLHEKMEQKKQQSNDEVNPNNKNC